MNIRRPLVIIFALVLSESFCDGQQTMAGVSEDRFSSACVDQSKLSYREHPSFLCGYCTHVVIPAGFLASASLQLGKKTLHEYSLSGSESSRSLHLGLIIDKLVWAELFRRYREGEKNGSAEIVVHLIDAFGRKGDVSLWHISWSPQGANVPHRSDELPMVSNKLSLKECQEASMISKPVRDPALFVK